jgi:thiamine biosynthesis lipoprotein
LVIVTNPKDVTRSEHVLDKVEALFRSIETKMSVWLEDSEISRLNKSTMNVQVPLSPETLEVLRAASDAYKYTEGAFDITCRPLIKLWQDAGKHNRLPTEYELKEARTVSSWDLINFTATGVIKQDAHVQVDLGGIAKGYAIDRAINILKEARLSGGLVDIGGDMACFGQPPSGDYWEIEVRDPFSNGRLGQLRIRGGAVCTSGNYARFVEIDGKRYSHIIDPRTGKTADALPSVTVIGPSALIADIWATALSVLGTEGISSLPEGYECFMILGSKDDYSLVCTPGLEGFLDENLKQRVAIWDKE